MRPVTFLTAVAGLVSGALSDAVSFSPNTGIDLAVSIPEVTKSSGSGNMYMQFSAPATMGWAAFGIGLDMTGSKMFLIYQDGAGNITLSPRDGLGHTIPRFNSTLNSEVTLLEGSGVTDGMMVANIRYTTSPSVVSVAGTSTNWISAWFTGSPMNTVDQSVRIGFHSGYSQFTLDLSQASQSDDTNPFIAASSTGSPTGGPSATNAVSTPTATGSSGGAASAPTLDMNYLMRLLKAHGIIMALTMLIILPLGAVLIRLIGGPWLHAGVQLLGLCLIIAGFGIGYRFADLAGYLYKGSGMTHTAFGTVIFALFLLQPIGGIVHHLQFRKTQARGIPGYIHVWYGRVVIILGVVNGGLGLKLAHKANKYLIAYGVVAGVVGIIYIGTIVLTGMKKRKAGGAKVRGEDSVASGSQHEVKQDVAFVG